MQLSVDHTYSTTHPYLAFYREDNKLRWSRSFLNSGSALWLWFRRMFWWKLAAILHLGYLRFLLDVRRLFFIHRVWTHLRWTVDRTRHRQGPCLETLSGCLFDHFDQFHIQWLGFGPVRLGPAVRSTRYRHICSDYPSPTLLICVFTSVNNK